MTVMLNANSVEYDTISQNEFDFKQRLSNLHEFPASLELQSSLDHLAARFSSNPAGFFVFINSMPSSLRREYLALIAEIFTDSYRFEELNLLLRYVADDTKVQFSETGQTSLAQYGFGYKKIDLPEGDSDEATPIQIIAEAEMVNLDERIRHAVEIPGFENGTADVTNLRPELISATLAPVVLSPGVLLDMMMVARHDVRLQAPGRRLTPEMMRYYLEGGFESEGFFDTFSTNQIFLFEQLTLSRLRERKINGDLGLPEGADISVLSRGGGSINLSVSQNGSYHSVQLPLSFDPDIEKLYYAILEN
jgi:hypothetical protein